MAILRRNNCGMRAHKNYILLAEHFCPICKKKLRASAICASHTFNGIRREEIFAKFHCDSCKRCFSVQEIRRHERMQKYKKLNY